MRKIVKKRKEVGKRSNDIHERGFFFADDKKIIFIDRVTKMITPIA